MLMAVLDGALPIGPADYFQQYGVLGAVVIAIIFGWLVPGWYVKHLTEENRRLTLLLEEKVIPMTSTYADTVKQSTEALEKAAQAIAIANADAAPPGRRRAGE